MKETVKVDGNFSVSVEGAADNANEAMLHIIPQIVGNDSDNLLDFIKKLEHAGVHPGFNEKGKELTYDDVKLLSHMGYAATATCQFGLLMAVAVSQLPPERRGSALANAFKRLEENMFQAVAEAKHVMAQTVMLCGVDAKKPN